ncbi:MAG TPA: hypothetical protein VET89_03550 [Stellaceae bacterium]|nr:hypothetical protein [Stellaceae bacterium]
MDVSLTAEQEALLAELAARDGCTPADLIAEAVARFLDEEAQFVAAVQAGPAAEEGDFGEGDEVWARVERILRS